MQQSSQYQLLLEKLDKFTRKYYTNQVIRGAIFSVVYVLAFFLAINVLEYYLFLSPLLRKVMFFGFIISSVLFVARFLGQPLLHYYRLGKIISHEQAAQIIGTHFTEVKDKLLNVLQLKKMATGSEMGLLNASIDQKIVEIKPVDFGFAIDLNKNRKYIKYLLPPLFLFLFIIIAAPNVLKEGTKRLYYNDTYFEKEAPFKFQILNKSLQAMQFENYELEVKVDGEALPSEVYLNAGDNTFKLKKKDKNLFTYEFVNVQNSLDFRFEANGYHSKQYKLDVVSKPTIASFEVVADYPSYTGKPDETIKNIGDLVVPAGTRLNWKFEAKNCEQVIFMLGDSAYTAKRTGTNEFSFTKTFFETSGYAVVVGNNEVKNADSVSYSLNVVPDLYPTISVNEKRDSANERYFYYLGEASDDYGLRRLEFHYSIERADSGEARNISKTVDVPISTSNLSAQFAYYWNTQDFNLLPGDKMTYFFEVWDNDGIHGSKSTRSSLMSYQMPTLGELNKEIAEENKDLKKDMKESMKDAQDLKDKLRDMQDKMLDKKNIDWQDKKEIADAIEKQKALEEQMKDLKERMKENFDKQNEFKDTPPAIKEKQEKLQELFDKVMDDEMKKLYEKLQAMLEQLQKKDAVDKMQDMEVSNEKMEKELDRMLELFKKLEFDQKLQETASKLEKLAEKQEELAKQTENNKSADNKEQKEQQEKLEKELQEAKKDVEDLKKLDKELETQQDFKEIEQSLDNAEKQMDDAQGDMKEQKNQKASQNQKSAANNMKNASQKLQQMQNNMEMEQQAEDMQAIRQLLENIVSLSFDEEKLMANVKATNINNPKYVELMKEQQRIRENSKMVEDSLYAIAKRQIEIESFVTKEITNVNKYLGKSIQDMEDRNTPRAMSNQQFVMTGYNNLALMLSESLQQMQQQMAESQEQKQGGTPKNCKNCKKPGGGMPNLSKMQKQLNDKISQMGEMMKKEGQGQKPGEKPGNAGQGNSKEFAEMAAMQSKIRKELEKLNQEQNKNGKNPMGNLGDAIKQMEQTETQLVNKQITAEMLSRQQDIMNRMLEAENAQRQQDEQKERESNTAKEQPRKMPPSLEEYLKAKQSEVDLYKTVPPGLKPYYKSLAERYFRNITNQQ
jgi:hypothetical protein